MSYLIAASRIDLHEKCIGSAALPRSSRETEPARLGIAVHAFLESASKVGVEAAIEAIEDEEIRSICEKIDTGKIKLLATAHAEMGFGYDPFSGDVAWAQRGTTNEEGLKSFPVIGWADLCMPQDGVAIVKDYKTGVNAPEAVDSRQLKYLGLFAATAWGCDEAECEIVHIMPNGFIRTSVVHYSRLELEMARDELRRLVEKANKARLLVEDGKPESLLKAGPWCERCPSLPYCPAQMRLVKVLADDPDGIANRVISQLTPATAKIAYERWKSIRGAINRIGEALHAYAAQTPIELGDGKVFGARKIPRREIDAEIAWKILSEVYGTDAKLAFTLKTSQAGLERMLRARGDKIAPGVKKLMQDFNDAGGIEKTETSRMEEYKVGS